MATVEFKQTAVIAEMMQVVVGAVADTCPEDCIFILAAMPAPINPGDSPAFLVASSHKGGSKETLEIITLLKNRLEQHIEKLRRMN